MEGMLSLGRSKEGGGTWGFESKLSRNPVRALSELPLPYPHPSPLCRWGNRFKHLNDWQDSLLLGVFFFF